MNKYLHSYNYFLTNVRVSARQGCTKIKKQDDNWKSNACVRFSRGKTLLYLLPMKPFIVIQKDLEIKRNDKSLWMYKSFYCKFQSI